MKTSKFWVVVNSVHIPLT